MALASTHNDLLSSSNADDELAFLDALSLHELQRLSNELTPRLEQLPSTRNAQAFLAELHASNRELAEGSLSKQKEMARIRARIDQLATAYWETRQELERLDDRRLQVAKRFTPDALLKQLRALATQADVTSDECWDRFLNEHGSGSGTGWQSMDAEQFAADYVRLRTDYHKRAAQADRLAFGADTTWRNN
ncbi:hypothetical protein BDF22DRAFT_136947 [Syncephalis plumigaleata]|nr:hypothetical protein BDF22DRAFT_136947 [Syncephalis plumigaleata]